MPDPAESKFDKIKKFANQHKVLLACSATAAVTYALASPLKGLELNSQLKRVRYELEGLDNDFENLLDYVAAKDLLDEYFAMENYVS